MGLQKGGRGNHVKIIFLEKEVNPINLRWPMAREEGVTSPLTKKWEKVLKAIFVLCTAFLILGCANHKTTRQLEIEYYEIMAKQYDLVIKKLTSDYKECDRLFKTERLDYQSLTECQKRAEEYSRREMERLDNNIKEHKEEMRHQELIDAIRRR